MPLPKKIVSCAYLVLAVVFIYPSLALSDAPGRPLEITIDDPLPERLDESFPGSISEIRSKNLQESGFLNLDSVINRIPNVTWSAGTSRPRFLFIRGIGDLDQYAGSGLPAVTVIDDGLNLSGIAQGVSLFDSHLARIERGPTGFFGGPSSLAGLVSFESGPQDLSEIDGESSIIESSLGTGGLRTIAGRTALGVPKQFALLSAEQAHQDGFLRNGFLGRNDTNHQDTTVLKGKYKLTWGSGSDFSANLVSRHNNDGYDAFTIDNTRTTRSDQPGADDLGLNGGALHSTLVLDPQLRLDLDGSLMHASSTYSYDGDWGNDDFWYPYLPYDYFSITDRNRHLATGGAKITFGSASETLLQLGAYGQRLSENTYQEDRAGEDPYRILDSKFMDERLAIHAAFSQHLSPSVRAWIASRVEHQEVTNDDDVRSLSQSETAPLFQVGIEHRASNVDTIFLKGARGWRGGGFNVGAAVPEDRVSFDPEYLTEVSLGLHHNLTEPSSFVEISLFRAFRYDQQVRLELQTDPSDPLSFVYVTDNAARGDTVGLEATTSLKLTPKLRFETSAALLDASFSEFDGGRQELQNRDAALAPNWRLTADARYQISSRWFAGLGAVSTDRFYFDDANDAQSASITLLNASVGYEFGKLSIIAWGQNLLDRRYAVRGFYFGNEPPDFNPTRYIQRGAPLSGGITIIYSF